MAKRTTTSFFETYPEEYDALTGADSRAVPHGKEVDALIARFQPTAVLDAGCATGLTSSLFARKGVSAVGLDRSRPMLAFATKKFEDLKDNLTFKYGQFEKLPRTLTEKFDLVVCLANAITGVGNQKGLREALTGFHRCLRPGGHLVLQLLNYVSMAEGQLFPIKATSERDIVYERFSERLGKRINLYVTRADLSVSPVKLEVFRHEFDNFTVNQVEAVVRRSGFVGLKRYGNLRMDQTFRKTGRDLVLIARKSERRGS
ncbi:MAG TPA: class I SAM-dependent methyltransferase [candidate division Zixibacteria bacterium]|nr:class I SAM-dependent methyltransferase [candidate division Zixibacteria bacterium]